VETSGFQPGAQPSGFAPGPAADETPADAGWTYSFVAEQATTVPEEAAVEETVDSSSDGQAPLAPTAEAGDWQEYAPPAEPSYLPPAEAPVPAPSALDTPSVPEQPVYQPVAAYEPPAAVHVAPEVTLPDQTVATQSLPPAPNHWVANVVGVEGESGLAMAESEAEESAYNRVLAEQSLEEDDLNLNDLLELVLARGASDLHLTSGARPTLRLNGELVQLEDYPILTPPVIQRVMYAALTQKQREKFEETLELDFAYSVPGRARFRVNLYRQRDALGSAFRLIPFEIKKLEDLGVPPTVANFASLPRGFVLVTGPTGSGKSTTLASMIDLANRTRRDHIMTVEDPIEFLHRHQSCIVNQREVGEDTWSFQNALKHVLRQDPDIILVGEMRDLETIQVALTAAETGHLVFATLHTQDAAQTIDRVIDVFPPHQQQQVRVQLAGTLQGVVCQTLCRTRDGKGRVVATEVLYATPAIRNLIREGKTHQIYSAMQAGAKHGMHTMDQHLADLVMRGSISYEVGIEKCHHVEDFNRLTGRG